VRAGARQGGLARYYLSGLRIDVEGADGEDVRIGPYEPAGTWVDLDAAGVVQSGRNRERPSRDLGWLPPADEMSISKSSCLGER
jgi:hypothetical protein